MAHDAHNFLGEGENAAYTKKSSNVNTFSLSFTEAGSRALSFSITSIAKLIDFFFGFWSG
jgi:hypothetical protein